MKEKINLHRTFISYHHKNEQNLKDEIIETGVEGEEFIDKSVADGDIDRGLEEETIMRKIREDYLQGSTVIIVLIGEKTADRPFINSEIQAGLWKDPTGLVGIVRDDLYDRIYQDTICNDPDCMCGKTLNTPTNEFKSKIPYLVRKNQFILEDNASTKPHFNNSDAYSSIYKYSYFINNMEKIIDEAFEKRDKNYNIKIRNENGIKTITNPYGN